ncbi:MAG: iron-containing alcohol dehydrogenase [Bacteroidetes bacterium]|nr:iron-containing alcohol dehydrogenase [Bacteroidota bacterium]
MVFEFSTAQQIIVGRGTIQHLPTIVCNEGHRAFLVCGKNRTRIERVLQLIHNSGVHITLFTVPTEPTVEIVMQGTLKAREELCNVVIGIGGGSVLDAGKAIAAMITNSGKVTDYLEVIGHGKRIEHPPVPYIAVPTTAGTGAEVTSNAVLTSPAHQLKVSIRSKLLFPRVALVDPELTYSMPPFVTASTGLDALTQLIEAYVSNKANPFTDALCVEGIRRAGRSLYSAYTTGDPDAREDMCIASLFSGIALANSKLGAVHGLAAPLGGVLSAPHGVLCARLLPLVVEKNIELIANSKNLSLYLEKYNTLAQLLTANMEAYPSDCVQWLKNICEKMAIPRLQEYGLTVQKIPDIARQALRSSSMKGNPVEMNERILEEILLQAL